MNLPREQWLQHTVLGGLCALGAILLILALNSAGVLTSLEWLTYDARLRAFNADRPAPPEIAVILIDEASLQYMNTDAGRWPWPRSVHGDLLEFLALGEPKAVVFDVLFVERQRDPNNPDGFSPHDQQLVDATAQAGFVTHATQVLSETADELKKSGKLPSLPADYVKRYSLHELLQGTPPPSIPFNDVEIPIPGLWEAAKHSGVVRAEADSDGRYRRMQLLYPYNGSLLPSLALAPVLDALNPRSIRYEPGVISFDKSRIPVDHEGKLLVNQYGVFRPYSYAGIISSLKDIRAGETEKLIVDPAEFKDRIVFIGADAVGVQDLKATALSPKTAGVYLQASIAGNLLHQEFLTPGTNTQTVTLIILMALVGAASALLVRQVSLKLLAVLVSATFYVAAAYYAFSQRWVVDIVAPVSATLVAWFLAFSYLFFTEGKDKRRVRKVLAQYVSPAVLAEVVDKYSNYLEVGRKETVSVLFSDIRSFTTVSESLPAEKVVEMLNIYFTEMNDVIFAENGTIDKFIGDAIMAFWGAPIRDPQHAIRSVRAAVNMIRALPKVNATVVARGIPELHIGVGIHTGEAVVGNIGSEKKLAYTAIGDNVNLASRLEGLTKQYGCSILISETTQAIITEAIPCRVIDAVRVKGKKLPIRIFAPLPVESPEDSQNARALCERTAAAFEHYQQRRFEQALAAYRALPADALQEIFVERCETYLQSPPDGEWDGIYTLTSK